MLCFDEKARIGLRIHDSIQAMAADPDLGTDVMRVLLHYAGMVVETAFLFDSAEESLEASLDRLERDLGVAPDRGPMGPDSLPPATFIDFDAEQGRAMAREFFEEWLDCPYAFHDQLMTIIHQAFVRWERFGMKRAESLRLFEECVYKMMAFELAAQELCDAVIEHKIGVEGWTMADSIAGLAGMAGRKLALSHDGKNQCCWFRGHDLPDFLDQTAYVMTQEAVRLGLNSSVDWRFGLPANDCPANPPTLLIKGLGGLCQDFFAVLDMPDLEDQAVACAKAAGRMLAVVSGGEAPEVEPAVAKPLAMAALTESYKSVCVEYAQAL